MNAEILFLFCIKCNARSKTDTLWYQSTTLSMCQTCEPKIQFWWLVSLLAPNKCARLCHRDGEFGGGTEFLQLARRQVRTQKRNSRGKYPWKWCSLEIKRARGEKESLVAASASPLLPFLLLWFFARTAPRLAEGSGCHRLRSRKWYAAWTSHISTCPSLR